LQSTGPFWPELYCEPVVTQPEDSMISPIRIVLQNCIRIVGVSQADELRIPNSRFRLAHINFQGETYKENYVSFAAL
jgi:hypothetical protein